jgi:membrane protease YdiL (CAAX protease family)
MSAGGILANVIAALVLFTAVVGGAQGLAAANAGLTPAWPWFPFPALALLAGAAWFCRRRWDLRLRHPGGVPWGRAYGAALLGTVAAVGVGALEAWFNGLTRSAPTWPGTVPAAFNVAFLVTLPFIAAVMAEVAFRGVIQTLLEKVWPIWAVLLGVAVLNGLMHFYDPDQMRHWLRFLSLNGVWGYVTWRTQSLLPALTAHVTMNLVEPWSERLLGTTNMGTLPPMALAFTAAMAVAAAAGALFLLRGWRGE